MKKIYLIVLCFISVHMNSQSHELNLGVGFSNYQGDLNSIGTDNGGVFGQLLKPADFKMSYSLGYRYNFPNYLSVGLSIHHMYVAGYDANNVSSTPYDAAYYRLIRNLSFHSVINQASLDLQFEPLRVSKKWDNGKWLASPYINAGLGIFHFNPKTIDNSGKEVELQPLGTEGQGTSGKPEKYSLTQLSVPVALGVKFYDPSRTFAIAFDLRNSFTFTDYIDDVSTVYADPSVFGTNTTAINLANRNTGTISEQYITGPGQKRGNPNNNDNFYTGQIKFSWFFLNSSKEAYYKCCGY